MPNSIWVSRYEDFARHLDDLRQHSYEGARARPDRDEVFRRGFELVTPVAVRVLEDINGHLLGSAGEVTTVPPYSDGSDGLEGKWVLSWPAQRKAMDEHAGTPLEPVEIVGSFPIEFTHAHFMAPRPGFPIHVVAWPFQIVDAADAERQEPVLRILAEALLHERIYQADSNWEVMEGTAWTAALRSKDRANEESR